MSLLARVICPRRSEYAHLPDDDCKQLAARPADTILHMRLMLSVVALAAERFQIVHVFAPKPLISQMMHVKRCICCSALLASVAVKFQPLTALFVPCLRLHVIVVAWCSFAHVDLVNKNPRPLVWPRARIWQIRGKRWH